MIILLHIANLRINAYGFGKMIKKKWVVDLKDCGSHYSSIMLFTQTTSIL